MAAEGVNVSEQIKCCRTCECGYFDEMQGYVCVNADSEYVADFVEHEHVCNEYSAPKNMVSGMKEENSGIAKW